jgi:hypothetical protein
LYHKIEDINSTRDIYTKQQLILLNFLFNYIIPESKSLEIPGASILLHSIDDFSIESKNLIIKSISIIELILVEKIKIKSINLTEKEIVEIIVDFKNKNVRVFNELIFTIIKYYYCNENVLKSIKIKSIPPYPDGNFIEEGNILLLENVFTGPIKYVKP